MKIKINLQDIENLKKELRENTIFEFEEGISILGDMNHIHFRHPKNKGIRRAFDYYVVAELYRFPWNKKYICMFYLTGKYLSEEDKRLILNLVMKYNGEKNVK